jgi:hypothetical protein
MADNIEVWVGYVCFLISLWGKLHIPVYHTVVSAGHELPINGFSLRIRSDLPIGSEWDRVLDYLWLTALRLKQLNLIYEFSLSTSGLAWATAISKITLLLLNNVV